MSRRRSEDPVAELGIVFRPVAGTIEVEWTAGPGNRRETVRLPVRRPTGIASRLDAVVYDPALPGPPFELVEGGDDGRTGKIRPGPGRKVVALLALTPGLGVRLMPVPRQPKRRTVDPVLGPDLDLVAAIADRISDDGTTLLDDLAAAGLVVEIRVSRLTAPLGRLVLSGGRFRWADSAEAADG